MKIKTIEFTNHPIFGNKKFSFFNKETNRIYETILFAGENGSGKTSLLLFLDNIHLFFDDIYIRTNPNNSTDQYNEIYDFYSETEIELNLINDDGRPIFLTSVPEDFRFSGMRRRISGTPNFRFPNKVYAIFSPARSNYEINYDPSSKNISLDILTKISSNKPVINPPKDLITYMDSLFKSLNDLDIKDLIKYIQKQR
jgi:energy-coupling factor transporter ATP-binding protein EcfA2